MEVNCAFTASDDGGSVVGCSSGTCVMIGRRKEEGIENRLCFSNSSRSSAAENPVSPMKSLVRSFSPAVPMVSTISLIRLAASSVHTSSLSAKAGNSKLGNRFSSSSISTWRFRARWNQGSVVTLQWLKSETRARRIVQSMFRVGVKDAKGSVRRWGITFAKEAGE